MAYNTGYRSRSPDGPDFSVHIGFTKEPYPKGREIAAVVDRIRPRLGEHATLSAVWDLPAEATSVEEWKDTKASSRLRLGYFDESGRPQYVDLSPLGARRRGFQPGLSYSGVRIENVGLPDARTVSRPGSQLARFATAAVGMHFLMDAQARQWGAVPLPPESL